MAIKGELFNFSSVLKRENLLNTCWLTLAIEYKDYTHMVTAFVR